MHGACISCTREPKIERLLRFSRSATTQSILANPLGPVNSDPRRSHERERERAGQTVGSAAHHLWNGARVLETKARRFN